MTEAQCLTSSRTLLGALVKVDFSSYNVWFDADIDRGLAPARHFHMVCTLAKVYLPI